MEWQVGAALEERSRVGGYRVGGLGNKCLQKQCRHLGRGHSALAENRVGERMFPRKLVDGMERVCRKNADERGRKSVLSEHGTTHRRQKNATVRYPHIIANHWLRRQSQSVSRQSVNPSERARWAAHKWSLVEVCGHTVQGLNCYSPALDMDSTQFSSLLVRAHLLNPYNSITSGTKLKSQHGQCIPLHAAELAFTRGSPDPIQFVSVSSDNCDLGQCNFTFISLVQQQQKEQPSRRAFDNSSV
ncbi:hypothetical protein BJ166DRAFT_239787 [Pestalotiopsis sp. NC0098]|nr:hypothetical protein BJ166DRAFT_239787 [Pestalotiopsis sp. NC0098]